MLALVKRDLSFNEQSDGLKRNALNSKETETISLAGSASAFEEKVVKSQYPLSDLMCCCLCLQNLAT